MLLAEANQWPTDVRAYFGDGDECHMAYHFPLMPRMFMGLHLEDRQPIVDIMQQTPAIPDVCQWALFLRNHDELTLEMVTDEERDYMYLAYSADSQARLNLGIRRRLAPLVGNNRRRIELLNSMLFSFPGTPIVYYGDEIGMGDNIYLGDRNGVRTPMQWTGDRNARFSRADPARLYSPVIMDPIYGYQAVNVEAQERDGSSLLQWMKNLISLRKLFPAFGLGPGVSASDESEGLAYLRRHGPDAILCVANLSRSIQPWNWIWRVCGLHAGRDAGSIPNFPSSGRSPFSDARSLGYYWFELSSAMPEAAPAQAAIVAGLLSFRNAETIGSVAAAVRGRLARHFDGPPAG
jgi:maltose alpha-D-glucosyltransferase/alpha-amylase